MSSVKKDICLSFVILMSAVSFKILYPQPINHTDGLAALNTGEVYALDIVDPTDTGNTRQTMFHTRDCSGTIISKINDYAIVYITLEAKAKLEQASLHDGFNVVQLQSRNGPCLALVDFSDGTLHTLRPGWIQLHRYLIIMKSTPQGLDIICFYRP